MLPAAVSQSWLSPFLLILLVNHLCLNCCFCLTYNFILSLRIRILLFLCYRRFCLLLFFCLACDVTLSLRIRILLFRCFRTLLFFYYRLCFFLLILNLIILQWYHCVF